MGSKGMRLARVVADGRATLAVAVADGFVVTQYASIHALVAAGERGLEATRDAAARGRPAAGLAVLAPIERPGKVICTGINYHSHLDENPAATLPSRPFFFAKLPSAVIGPGAPIVKPNALTQLDPEVELAVVIGRRARNLTPAAAMEYVFGYTILNDVSARDWQFAPDGQMMLSKGMDSFCPLGPVIVTADEIADPANLRLRTLVNGEVRQDSTTAENIFDLPTVLAALTACVTLEPGDVVSTGTPAGVGLFRHPQVWLEPGDDVVLEIEGIGALTNPVVAAWAAR